MHSIAILTAALETCQTNEPINRAAGNIDQADLELATIADIQASLAILQQT